jgi:hypothetical protein
MRSAIRRERRLEIEQDRNERFELDAVARAEDAAADLDAFDAVVRQTIELYRP